MNNKDIHVVGSGGNPLSNKPICLDSEVWRNEKGLKESGNVRLTVKTSFQYWQGCRTL